MKLALVQMKIVGGAPEANADRAEQLIARAAAEGADTILLPEAMNLGWTHPSGRTHAESLSSGATATRLAAAARRHRVHVCAGLIEREGGHVYNSAILITPDGEVALRHRKLNELALAHDFYASGASLSVVRTTVGTLGVMICADGFARSQWVARSLALMGAEIILSPCAWAVPAEHDNHREPYGRLWRDEYGAVARDHGVWIAGCSNVGLIDAGPWKGRLCIGSSLVVAPGGEVVLQGPYGADAEAVLHVTIPRVPRPREAHHP